MSFRELEWLGEGESVWVRSAYRRGVKVKRVKTHFKKVEVNFLSEKSGSEFRSIGSCFKKIEMEID